MNALTKLMVELEDKDSDLYFAKSSLFHGRLMDSISPSFAEKMHHDGVRPYMQCLYKIDGKSFWEINTLNQEAFNEIILPILNSEDDAIDLEHNNASYKILSKNLSQTSIDKLINEYYFGNCKRYISIYFCTPTAFKQKERYVFYPDIRLIYQSLMNRFEVFSDQVSLQMDGTLDDLCDNTEIVKYRLHSVSFPLEGIKIPAFMGNIRIKIHGPQPLVNLIHLLLHYGEYSGIGIKTALGMGKMEIADRRDED